METPPIQNALNFCLLDDSVKHKDDNSSQLQGLKMESVEFVRFIHQSFRMEPKTPMAVAGDIYRGVVPRCGVIVNNYVTSNPLLETYPYDYQYVTFVARRPPYRANTWAMLRCFSSDVWLALVVAIILAAVAHRLAFGQKVSLHGALFRIATSLVGNAKPWRPVTRAQTILVYSWTASLTVLVLSYTSVLLSILSVPVRERGLETLDDVYQGVLEGRVRAREIDLMGIGYLMTLLNDEKVRVIGKDALSQEGVSENSTAIGHGEAVFSLRNNLDTFYSDRKKYQVSEDRVAHFWFVGFILGIRGPVRLQYGEQINRRIHWIWSGRLMERVQKRKRFVVKLYARWNSAGEEEEPVRPLSMDVLSGAFTCLIAGHLLSAVLLALEVVSKRCPFTKSELMLQ